MKAEPRSREELMRLLDEEDRISAAYGRTMGALERDEPPAAKDLDVLYRLVSPEQKAECMRAATACIQLLAAEGNAEAIDLAREHGITFRPLLIQ